MRRILRPMLLALAACPVLAGPAGTAAPDPAFEAVAAARALSFPADFGSHPRFRTEWWYLTGWLSTPDGAPLGFQLTFFRSRPGVAEANPSTFAPRQLLIAHVALSDPRHGRLWLDQRVRRAGLGLAEAQEGDTAVWVGDWSLRRSSERYRALVTAPDFALDLTLAVTQPPLLNGDGGLSRKGPAAAAASFYYSVPHLAVTGRLARGDRREPVSGEAWLDHEWSSEYLDGEAVGWDWIGIDLEHGAALMAFRIRDAAGRARWAGGSLRDPDGRTLIFDPSQIEFTPQRLWRSPRTGVDYPVGWTVRAGARRFELEPLMDDQENDTRPSTGAIYWEGAVRASENGRPAGRGYLELTGYGEPLRLR